MEIYPGALFILILSLNYALRLLFFSLVIISGKRVFVVFFSHTWNTEKENDAGFNKKIPMLSVLNILSDC